MPTSTTTVYAGTGSSHSWTWLADLFESNGILSVRFVDEKEFVSALGDSHGAAVISGGDGYSIASALGEDGFDRLKGFIEKGGLYVGICAGAYLPLPSSLEPFSKFNVSTTKIENIWCRELKKDESPRLAVPYGSCIIVHPVRGAVLLKDNSGSLLAPLYGGPVFREPDHDSVLMRYSSFTDGTEMQIPREEAEDLVLGRPAVIKSSLGNGSMLLFGPHLEHPRFPEANSRFLQILGYERTDWPPQESVPLAARPKLAELGKSVSDLKVAVYGLENRSFTVGRKAWDGGRLLELVMAIEKRAYSLGEGEAKSVRSRLERARELLVRMSVGTDAIADEATQELVSAARETVDRHFRSLADSARLCIDDRFGYPA